MDPLNSTPEKYTVYEYNNAWGDQLTKVTEYTNQVKTKEISYAYDAIGNPTTITDLMNSYMTKNLSWDGRQLYCVSRYNVGISFKYNDEGVRTSKALGSPSGGYLVTYVVDGSRILAETKFGDTTFFTYDADGSLISMNRDGNEYFYITNLQGDVIELVDINGTTVVKYKYDSWGNIIFQYDSGLGLANANPFRYRGNFFDIETGWYYIQSRFFDPVIGRWISPDSFSSISSGEVAQTNGMNLYEYCFNNPSMYYDPDGFWPEKVEISPWKYRIDKKNTDKEHIHIFHQRFKDLTYAQNIDGSVHDSKSKSGTPPDWVTRRIRAAGIWDWKDQFSLLPQEKPYISKHPLLSLHEYLEKFPLQRQTNSLETIPANPPQNSVETFPTAPSTGYWETIPALDSGDVTMAVSVICIIGIIVFIITGGSVLILV